MSKNDKTTETKAPERYVLGEPSALDCFPHPTDGQLVGRWPGGEALPVEPPDNATRQVRDQYEREYQAWAAKKAERAELCSKIELRDALQPANPRAPRATIDPRKVEAITRDGDGLVLHLWGGLYMRAEPKGAA